MKFIRSALAFWLLYARRMSRTARSFFAGPEWKPYLLLLGVMGVFAIMWAIPKPKGPQVIAYDRAAGVGAPITLPSQVKFNLNTTGSVQRTLASKLGDMVSVLDFAGCDPTGVADSGACIQAAMNYIVANNGATIYFPKGTYKYATPITIAASSGIRLIGESWDFQQTGVGGTSLVYTGTASPAFAQLTSASNPSFEGLNFEYTNAGFTGTLFQLNGSDSAVFRRVTFMGRGVATATYLLSLNGNSGAHLLESQFDYAQYAILGQAVDGTGNANSAKVQACRSGGNIAIATIRNPGQGWEISGNDFEAGNGATFTGSIIVDAAVAAGANAPAGLAVHGNWFGDFVPGGVVKWIQYGGFGLSVVGNFFNCANTGTGVLMTATSSGLHVAGNKFQSCSVAVNAGASITSEISVTGNSYVSVTTPFSGTPADHAIVQSPSTSVSFDIWSNGAVQFRLLNTGVIQLNSLLTVAAAKTGSASNLDLAGLITLSTGSGTFTFNNAYTSAPVCVCTDTTAANVVKCSASTTVLTATGTGTDVIAYTCVGRN